ncbi:hypothetical protein SAMN06893096_111118 [Geodermatophilus pulveris]|uniref:Phage integrase family protein n=2 Tax=Geodermatophilus pulveris TaxID=1564159 RepID=A0A239IRA3_9ACTN|nr:hypothetical protein SAMN06893096_111118 [Geodermatophilus pulveris]
MTRIVVRGVLDLATEHDAIPADPVRSAGPISVRTTRSGTRDTERAFTPRQRDAVVAFADADMKARRRDLPDLVATLAGTGSRIAGACALRGSSVHLAGPSAREIANYPGHARASTTQDVSMCRHTVSERAAEMLTLGRQQEGDRGSPGDGVPGH